jgi:uncharacterized membrane protein
MKRRNIFHRVWRFYADGFRQMTVGRYLWAMILIKVAILFLVFRLFFFPDRLQEDYSTDSERAQAVRCDLVNRTVHADTALTPEGTPELSTNKRSDTAL